MNIVGTKVKITVGPYSNLVETSVIILEQIGYGFLGQSECGKYCSIHYNICGRLYAPKLDSEVECRKIAEQSKYRIS